MILAELTWPEVETLNRDIIVVCPIAALEQHSRHLPFFTDSILCESVVTQIEKALPQDVLLMPVQWLGASAHHLGMAGTLSAGTHTYIDMLCEPLRCLLQHGFRRVLIVNGHGGNIDSFHLALRQLAIEFPNALLTGASYWEFGLNEIAEILEGKRKAVGHACEFETSMMLFLRPELVRKNEIADDELNPSLSELSSVYIPLDMKRQTRQGGTGQPTLATAEKGERLLNAVVAKGVETIQRLKKISLNPL